MSDWVMGLLIPLVPAVGCTAITFFLPRSKTRAWGRSLGRVCSKFLRQKLGVGGGEKVESRLQTTVSDFMEGVMEGMDSDDKE